MPIDFDGSDDDKSSKQVASTTPSRRTRTQTSMRQDDPNDAQCYACLKRTPLTTGFNGCWFDAKCINVLRNQRRSLTCDPARCKYKKDMIEHPASWRKSLNGFGMDGKKDAAERDKFMFEVHKVSEKYSDNHILEKDLLLTKTLWKKRQRDENLRAKFDDAELSEEFVDLLGEQSSDYENDRQDQHRRR